LLLARALESGTYHSERGTIIGSFFGGLFITFQDQTAKDACHNQPPPYPTTLTAHLFVFDLFVLLNTTEATIPLDKLFGTFRDGTPTGYGAQLRGKELE
jgi:hypothetical protein